MSEPVTDEHLRIALYDALRGVRLPSSGKKISDDDRQAAVVAIMERFRLSKWSVVCEPFKGFSGLAGGPGKADGT